MIEASAEKVAAMLEEARRQHPEESDGQHRKRVAYRLNALRKKDKIEVLHERIAKMESQDWRWWLIIAMFGLFIILFGVSQAHCQIAPNVNIQRIAGTNIASGIYDSGNTAFKVNCVVGCSATASFSDNGAFTVGTTTINVIGGYYTSGAAPTLSTGNAGRARIDASSFLMVNCASGCSGGASTPADTFAAPSTAGLTLAFPELWNGATFDRWYGDKTNGAWVNCKSGCAGGSTTPADTFSNPTTAGLSMTFPAVWNGSTWDRLYGDKTNGAFVNVKTSVLPTGAALDSSLTTLDTDVKANITLHAGTAVIGHVIADSGSTTAVTGNVAVTQADGADVTLGAKADAKSTATDTTAITLMQVLKEISAMEQAPASRAVTNVGTFAVQESTLDGAISSSKLATKSADGDFVTLGTKTDAAATQTDATAVSVISLLKELSAKAQSPAALPNNQSINVAQVNGATTSTAASGVQKVGIVGNAGAALDAATGAAPPANAILNAGLGSGATGGFLVAVPVSDTYKVINVSTATTTLLDTGVSGRQVRIGSLNLVTAGANNVALIEGTGATCGTGSAGMTGGTTAASGWNFAANGGMTLGTGFGTVMQTATTGDSVCVVTSASVQLSGGLQYTIY